MAYTRKKSSQHAHQGSLELEVSLHLHRLVILCDFVLQDFLFLSVTVLTLSMFANAQGVLKFWWKECLQASVEAMKFSWIGVPTDQIINFFKVLE